MSTVIALLIMAAVLAIPTVVIVRMYREEIEDRLQPLISRLTPSPRPRR